MRFGRRRCALWDTMPAKGFRTAEQDAPKGERKIAGETHFSCIAQTEGRFPRETRYVSELEANNGTRV